MGFGGSALIGFFFGFALGVGCALAVMYSIYTGGYRKAIEDSLLDEKPERFRNVHSAAEKRLGDKQADAARPPSGE